MADEEPIIDSMIERATSVDLNNTPTNINVLVFHVVVGSHVAEIDRPRNMNHQFPILAEQLIRAPWESFSTNLMQLITTKYYEEIAITQHIMLIDYAYAAPQYAATPDNLLPANIIEIGRAHV